MLTKTITVPVKLSDGTDSGGEPGFTGYASTFTREPDSYGDVVKKGAFAKTLKEWEESGRPIPVLWGHRMDDPDYFIGDLRSAMEDDHGLKVDARLYPDAPKAQRVRDLLRAGAVAQMSFAFDIRDSGTIQLSDGSEARELRDLKLYEVSVVPVGANQDTSIEDVKTPAVADALTPGEVAAVRALLAHQTTPEKGAADDNTREGAEATCGGKAQSRAEAVARLTQQIRALTTVGEKGDAA
ncbi:HK97 family phage prohead protease [Actinomyces sp. 432]|uniref:HK97 family phage prohead protease n=1 Tax=Actinomyces sp. 432 TaxID=2057798 RepID=UPI001373E451|nr:HK97 family phage prohead protease [Actinomyces sp. 432]QHO91930.1 HK97 family phage prohead protease [Actinomyces sp. 432]